MQLFARDVAVGIGHRQAHEEVCKAYINRANAGRLRGHSSPAQVASGMLARFLGSQHHARGSRKGSLMRVGGLDAVGLRLPVGVGWVALLGTMNFKMCAPRDG